MPLGIGKVGAERLGVKLADIEKIARLAPYGYNDWMDKRDELDEEFPDTAHWILSCHHFPRQVDIILAMFDEILDGCGIEAIQVEGEHVDNYHFDIVATYVNMGDTYIDTVLYDTVNDRFLVTSWGDFYEAKYYK